jgi:hypothetical protein
MYWSAHWASAEILARVTHYRLVITGMIRRTIRNRDQLIAAKKAVMDPHIQEVVASSTFETVFVRDKGTMLGGELWITHGNTGFRLGPITLE